MRVSNGLDPDRTNVLLVLTWVQTVCKGYQQTTKVLNSKRMDTFDAIYNMQVLKPAFLSGIVCVWRERERERERDHKS